ncbi:DoxX family membrane protein [Aureicoccus marinus]|uniref:DoxX protein n=1 Tax=Aureicoccus marinus TaxID=754435 RepID=A0A2S7TAN4_9FLAO|nr:DoxX family membrane protein [Aureicoccus marinus]PQJ16631.1 DoxX protein [Aureicoccus marinus]
MKKYTKIFYIVLRLFIGVVMINGGIYKFSEPRPSLTEVVQTVEELQESNNTNELKKTLYISGMQQTGYFWEVLGVCEIVFGLLLLLQGTSFIGAILLLPITFHIFFYHVFLEPEGLRPLATTGALFVGNILLVLKDRHFWKPLLWVHPWKEK